MPVDGPALLRMPFIEFLGIRYIMCEAIDNKTKEGKFDKKTKHAADNQICCTNRDPQTKPDTDNVRRRNPHGQLS